MSLPIFQGGRLQKAAAGANITLSGEGNMTDSGDQTTYTLGSFTTTGGHTIVCVTTEASVNVSSATIGGNSMTIDHTSSSGNRSVSILRYDGTVSSATLSITMASALDVTVDDPYVTVIDCAVTITAFQDDDFASANTVTSQTLTALTTTGSTVLVIVVEMDAQADGFDSWTNATQIGADHTGPAGEWAGAAGYVEGQPAGNITATILSSGNMRVAGVSYT